EGRSPCTPGTRPGRGRSPHDQPTSTSCARDIMRTRLDNIKCYARLSPRSGRDDVSEADRGEDRDREVQRICPGQRMNVEIIEIGLSHQKVDGCEQKEEQWRGGRERFDRSNRRIPSVDDRSYLVDRHGG